MKYPHPRQAGNIDREFVQTGIVHESKQGHRREKSRKDIKIRGGPQKAQSAQNG